MANLDRSKILVLGLFLASLMTCGCVVFEHPVGSWAEPVDLKLNASSLTGTEIEVQCLGEQGEDVSSHEMCVKLALSLKAAGATLIPDLSLSADTVADMPQGKASIRVVLQNTKSTTGFCGWSLIPMAVSFSFFPCKAESDTFAKLTLKDNLSGHEKSWPLQIHLNRYIGIGALVLMGVDNAIKGTSRLRRHEEIMHRFVVFVQSKTYTAAMKQNTSL